MKYWLSIIFFSMFLSIQAQEQSTYRPSLSKLPYKQKFQERIEMELAQDVAAIEGGNKKEISGIYLDRANYVLQAATSGEFIYGTTINTYTEAILNELLEGNPEIPADRIKLFISRDYVPNASCIGEGSIVMNIGLIRRFENESQVAFVLAHELAHYIDNHVNQGIQEYVSTKNSKATQKQIKQIRKAKYQRNQKGLDLLKSFTYNTSRHTRTKESAADAKAIELLSNTKYDLNEAVKALEMLDTIDEDKYEVKLNLIKSFDRQLYPFQPEWLEEENELAIFFGAGKTDQEEVMHPDSLKTHPNSLVRAEQVSKKISSLTNGGSVSIQPVSMHEAAVKQADFDMVLSAYHYKNYGLVVYQSLVLQEKYPDDPFLIGIIGAVMGEMAEAIEDKELGKILPQSSPAFEEDYNTVLKFLNGLSYKNMKEVGYNYVRTYRDDAGKSEALAYALALTSKLKGKYDDKEKYKGIYFNKFPNGYFVKQARKV
ncbi:MAG: M48 family metallopeptidase [Saprospiraceae bacterium]|nr:M48 family metallopeptidase [Saprospiraceae bacterium]